MFLILCKMDLPGFFLVYFRLFYRQTLQFLQQTDEKMSIYLGIFLSCSLYVYSKISICILPSLCVYYHLYGYSTISMRILPSLCVYYHLYVYTTISMCILPSICVYYHLYVYTTISMKLTYIFQRIIGGSGCLKAHSFSSHLINIFVTRFRFICKKKGISLSITGTSVTSWLY